MYYEVVESGKRIQGLRKNVKPKMSQEELAGKVGISLSAMSKVERGITGTTIDNLIVIGEIFGVSLDYLVLGESIVPDDEITKLLYGKPIRIKKMAIKLLKGILSTLGGEE